MPIMSEQVHLIDTERKGPRHSQWPNRGSSFISEVSLTEAFEDEYDHERLSGEHHSTLMEYSDTSDDYQHRRQRKASQFPNRPVSNGRFKNKPFVEVRSKPWAAIPETTEQNRIMSPSLPERANGLNGFRSQSKKSARKSAERRRSQTKHRSLDSGNWVTQLAASFRSPSPTGKNNRKTTQRPEDNPMFISSPTYQTLEVDVPHEESPLLVSPLNNDDARETRWKSRKGSRTPDFVAVAAALLRDYEANRPPVFSSTNVFGTISKRQVQLHQFRYGNMVYPSFLAAATFALFASCFFEGVGNRIKDDAILTALNIFAIIVFALDLLIVRDLNTFSRRKQNRLHPVHESTGPDVGFNQLEQPLVLFGAILLVENVARLLVTPGHSIIVFSSVFKPLVLFYVSPQAREAFQMLRVVMPDVTRVLLMDTLLLILFAAVACRMYQEYDGFRNLGAAWISLFTLSTTAGNPEIWLQVYEDNKMSAIFFIAFLVVSVFFMHSLILSVIFQCYIRATRELRRNAAARRDNAVKLAFKALAVRYHQSEVMADSRQKDVIPVSLVRETLEIIRPHYSGPKINALVDIVAPPYHETVDYASFQTNIRLALNASIRTTKNASTMAMVTELVAVAVAIVNFVYVILISTQFSDGWISSTAELTGFAISVVAGCEILIRFNPFRMLPDFTPLTRMNPTFDGIALVAACTSCFGMLLFFFPNSPSAALDIILVGRAMDMIRIMRFFQFFRDLVRRSSDVLPSLLGPFILTVTTMHVFVYGGMALWSGSVKVDLLDEFNSPVALYALDNFNSYREGVVTMFQMFVVNDWNRMAQVYLSAGRSSSPVVVYLFFIATYVAGVCVALNVLTAFFVETFVTKCNEDTNGPAEATALVREKEDRTGPYSSGFIDSESTIPPVEQESKVPSPPKRDGSDHDADSEGSSESGLFEFDVYERQGLDKLMRTSGTSAFYPDNIAQHICSYLEVFESLSPGRPGVGWLVCDQQTMDRFGNQLFQSLAEGYLDHGKLQSVVTDMHSELLVLAPTAASCGGSRSRWFPSQAENISSVLHLSGAILCRHPTLTLFVCRILDEMPPATS